MTPKEHNAALRKTVVAISNTNLKLAGDLFEAIKERDQQIVQNGVFADCIRNLATERDKLKKFKEYVHDRLNDMGVPEDPHPKHTLETGCRIEGRLDWVWQKMNQ